MQFDILMKNSDAVYEAVKEVAEEERRATLKQNPSSEIHLADIQGQIQHRLQKFVKDEEYIKIRFTIVGDAVTAEVVPI